MSGSLNRRWHTGASSRRPSLSSVTCGRSFHGASPAELAPIVGYPPPRRAAAIGEKYRGIRPAFGYPACPEHSENDPD